MSFSHLTVLYCGLIIFLPVPVLKYSPSFQPRLFGSITSNHSKLNLVEPAATNIIYQSKDNGKTWQDISYGLPENEQPEDFFADKSNMHMRLGGSRYRSKSNLASPVWEKESDIDPRIRSVASNNYSVMTQNVVESKGVLIATGQRGIRRSTDDGEHWEWVIREGGVGIAVEKIEGGFAAISCNTKTMSRRIHISMDDGKTWRSIDDGLRPTLFITSIKQVGNYLICGHPDGIFRSSDMGTTWNMVHPSVENRDVKYRTTSNSDPFEDHRKVFKIYVSGNTVYAVAGSAGC